MSANTARLDWLQRAYGALREGLIEEAPPACTLMLGFPLKKRTGKVLTLGEFHADAITDPPAEIGAEHLIVIHPLALDRPAEALAVLAHQMIHASLDGEGQTKHSRDFQAVAQRIGLVKPWAVPEADDTLHNWLGGVCLDLGELPPGRYQPPPPKEAKPSPLLAYTCSCLPPRKLSLSPKKFEAGPILCGACRERFRSDAERAAEA